MAQKKSYSRYFIILQEDEKGYALSHDKVPTGYVKLELKNDKCKVSYYVQNLKKEDAPYYMILILSKKDTNKILKLGELNIDEYGRVDVSYEYSSNNLGNTGMSIDDISGAAVSKFLGKNIISVLSGFLTTDIPKWRDFELIEPKSEIKKEENLEVKKEHKTIEKSQETSNKFTKYEDSIEEFKQKVQVEKTLNESEESIEKEIKNKELEDVSKKVQDEIISEEKSIKEEIIEHNNSLNEGFKDKEVYISNNMTQSKGNMSARNDEYDYIHYGKGETERFFEHIINGFEEVSEDIKDIKRCRWYKVPIKDIRDMYCINDYNKYTVIYYPMINYYNYIKSYKYFVMGYKYDENNKIKCIVYGIPGTKDLNQQPLKGKTGFVTWVPSNKAKENHCEGYWLMFYDFRDSSILIPVK